MAVKPVPDGMDRMIPHLVMSDANAAIEFYKKAFGAEEMMRMPGPGGKIMHAQLRINGHVLMLADEMMGQKSAKTMGGSPAGCMLYVEDADKVFERAVAAGATVEMPLANQFWGDRYGKLRDPEGYSWSIATQVEELTPAQMMERMKTAMPA